MSDFIKGILSVFFTWVISILGGKNADKKKKEKIINDNKKALADIDKFDSSVDVATGFSDFV